ncbi:glycosyltransferase involved in cell wall biosynthesis [Hydrogenoanaerobacterium saccharovorans]|uniref:Glycosyltransferase involved in cell wall bisynthesis n=1 Tax=Hydrogenoanaerobacterium saccharovorans TaxID=474960 RepID=A0A1H8EGP9_9FIRM|nr:glycosyltransferase family 2 protein [Hydrogenoanaerobacterium saccharovorans]RPF42148.1 glycosyltransferase involved in cell wall biosynthesis [Hydrogenoanaerobacterium saccharovorans]SEN17948.1 Glycosyltransferase involved in cell wall bisynthesis [Hydrogenoanaerobacterium saccharovorans]
MKKLAICIPAYNRPKELIDLLKSIILQIDDNNRHQVCIRVCDDCSPNDSLSSVNSFMSNYDIDFIMIRNQQNLRLDKNMLKVVSMADAQYCWLMGDDDALCTGAINKILLYCEQYPDIDVFLTNRYVCSRKLKPFMKEYLTTYKSNITVDFTNKQEVMRYFDRLYSTTCLGYATNLIIKKEKWDNVNCDKYIGTQYIHVAKYLSLLYKKGKLMLLADCLILSRFGNDNFYNSLKQRIFIDYMGFLKLSDMFSDDAEIKRLFLNVVPRHYNRVFLYAVSLTSNLSVDEIEIMHKLGYTKRDLDILKTNNKLLSFVCMNWNIFKQLFVDFNWFVKTSFITLQKIL